MSSGTVIWYDREKGVGFISPVDGGRDVFVHAIALEASGIDRLHEGQEISFEKEEDNGTVYATRLGIG